MYTIEEKCLDDVIYTKYKHPDSIYSYKNECRVTGVNPEAKNVIIKDYVDGVPVKNTDIVNSDNLESIVFGECITYICEKSFCDCPKLKCVTLPKSLKAMGEYAFASDNIETIIVQNTNLKYISEGALGSDSLRYFILRGSKKEIYIDVYNKNFEDIYYNLFTINKNYNMEHKYHRCYMKNHKSYIKDKYNIDNIIDMISERYPYTLGDDNNKIYKCEDILEFTEKLRSSF